MTLCIAGTCLQDGEPRFVLCCDTRLDYGFLGSRNTTVKVDVLGFGWVAQWAGLPGAAKDLIEGLKQCLETADDRSTRRGVARAVRKGLDDFQQTSPLYEKNCCAVLMTGFVQNQPMILQIAGNARGDLRVGALEDYGTIGEGGSIAAAILNHREFLGSNDIHRATYFVYEAKRFSEQVGSVGRHVTVLLWQAPINETMPPDTANIATLGSEALAYLHAAFRRFGPQPVPPLDDFPSSFIGPRKKAI